jgi:hypothetical protein
MSGQVIAYNLVDLLRDSQLAKSPARLKPVPDPSLTLFKAQYGL